MDDTMHCDPQTSNMLPSIGDEASIKDDFAKIKDRCRCCLADWTLLNRHLSRAARAGLNKSDVFRSLVKDVIDYFLLDSQLLSMWESLVSAHIEKSQSASVQAIQQISTGYRVIVNFFENYSDFPLDAKAFTKLVIKALHCYIEQITLKKEERSILAVAAIVLLLPTDFQANLMDVFFSTPNDDLVIVDSVSSSFILQSAYQFLSRKYFYYGRASSASSDVLLTSIEKHVFKRFVERALQDCHVTTVIDALLMQRAFPPSVAEEIVSILPDSSYIYLLDIVGSLWGEKLFISRGDWRAQEYLTTALISTLSRISGDVLSRSLDGGLPVATILSAGVSSYLDQSDRQSRLRGMRIAREFSVLLGHKIVFEELDEEDRNQKERLQGVLTSSGATASPLSTFESLAISEGLESSNAGLDDDSCDDEIEGYDLPFESPEDSVPLTPYLRVCLELLLCSDSDKDAHDKLLSALLSIPRVVSTHPADAVDVCGPLVKELLRLTNSYNTDDFDSLRSDALQSLVVAYPHQAVPVLQGAVEDESYSLGTRIFVISSLSKASLTLSNGPSREGSIHESVQNNGCDILPSSSASTSIKRPLRLAASKKKVTYFVNNFGDVGPIFFYPILRLLALSIAKDTSSKLNKSRKSQGNSNNNLSLTKEEYQIKPDNSRESFIRSSLSTSELKGEKKVVPSAIEEEDGDGLHSMIPAEALLALAVFVKCSVNSVCQSTFTIETMKAAFMLKDASSLSVRRASLAALYAAFESWLYLKKRRKQSPSRGGGALHYLEDVTGQLDRTRGETSASEKDEYVLVAAIVDWAVLSSKADPDEGCRALKVEIIRFAIEAFGLLEGQE